MLVNSTKFKKISIFIINALILPLIILYLNFRYFIEIFNAGRDFETFYELENLSYGKDIELVVISLAKDNRYILILSFLLFQVILLFIAGKLQDTNKAKYIKFQSIARYTFIISVLIAFTFAILYNSFTITFTEIN